MVTRLFRKRKRLWAALAAGLMAVPALFAGVAAAPNDGGSDPLQPDPGRGEPLPPDPADTASQTALADAVRLGDLVPARYHKLVLAAAQRHGIDPRLVAAVVTVESFLDPAAVGGHGEIGLMQILPSTGAMLARHARLSAYDLFDPATNLDLGTRYIALLLSRYGSLERALAAYNGGPTAVAGFATNAYAARVLKVYRHSPSQRFSPIPVSRAS